MQSQERTIAGIRSAEQERADKLKAARSKSSPYRKYRDCMDDPGVLPICKFTTTWFVTVQVALAPMYPYVTVPPAGQLVLSEGFVIYSMTSAVTIS